MRIAFHELAHCIAVWLAGGTVIAFNFNPFRGSTTWDQTITTIPPSSIAGIYLAGTVGEVIALLCIGIPLFFLNRTKKRLKLTGYWFLMLLILSTGYWYFCSYFCRSNIFDPIGFSIYSNVDLNTVGELSGIPFLLSVLLGLGITFKHEKKILVDPKWIHLWTLAVGFFTLILTGDVA